MSGDDAVARFVEQFALQLADMGWPRMAARAFAAILVSDSGRRTASELAEVLQVSPAAVSGAVQFLTHLGLVVRDREPGSRRDHFQLYDDMWYVTITRQDNRMQMLEKGLQEGIDAVGAGTPAGDRLAETRHFYAFMRQQLPRLIAEWERARRA